MGTFKAGVRIEIDLERARRQVDELEDEVSDVKRNVDQQKKTTEKDKKSTRKDTEQAQKEAAGSRGFVGRAALKAGVAVGFGAIALKLLDFVAPLARGFAGATGDAFGQKIEGVLNLLPDGIINPEEAKEQGARIGEGVTLAIEAAVKPIEDSLNSLKAQLPGLRAAFGDTEQFAVGKAVLGIGIAPEDLIPTFEKFRQFHVSQIKFQEKQKKEIRARLGSELARQIFNNTNSSGN